MSRYITGLPVTLVLLLSCTEPSRGGRLIDLSYTFLKDAPSHPTQRPFELQIVKRGLNKYGIWVEQNNLCTSEHAGTHMDAPVHLSKDGWTLDDVPIGRLYRRPGIMVDVSSQATKYDHLNNYQVGVRHLERWVAAHGSIPDGAVVIINTGWGRKFSGNSTAYSGIDKYNKLNFPGISLDLARWFTTYGHAHGQALGVVGVGIDTLSLDVGSSVKYEGHVIVLGHNLYVLENLANTDLLPPIGFTVTSLPLKVGGGSGSPVRVIAEVGEDGEDVVRSAAVGDIATMHWTALCTVIVIYAVLFHCYSELDH